MKFVFTLILNEKPKAIKGLKVRTDGEILCVRNPLLECMDFLNQTAAEIFKRCDGNHTVAEIIEELHHKYNLDKDKLAVSVIKCIRFLEARGLLQRRKYGKYQFFTSNRIENA